jgi:lauroyl/myristoyl acyltransferase
MIEVRDRLVEMGYAAGWRVLRTVPRGVAWPVFARGADLSVRRAGAGVRRLAENLRRVVGPELPDGQFEALLRDAMRSYARYWLEAFRLPALDREEILDCFHLEGWEMLAADVAAGRGAVVALPHAGNWDAAGAWVAVQGMPVATVAERLKPERLYERFLAYRRGLGMEIVPLTGGDRPPLEFLTERLEAGAIVPLLADRDLSAHGVEVDFFGGRTRMPAGPALLALRTGAPLYVVAMWNDPERPRGRLTGPMPVPGPEEGRLTERVRLLTQRIADAMAVGIAEHPRDWHMLQRLWLDSPGASAGPGSGPGSGSGIDRGTAPAGASAS